MNKLQNLAFLGFFASLVSAEFYGGHFESGFSGGLEDGGFSEGHGDGGFSGGHGDGGFSGVHGEGGFSGGHGDGGFSEGHGEGGEEHYDHHPHYQFEYSVHDPHTHDYKSHHEVREGDTVKGYYTVKEADGSLREVHYTADHKNGFQAVVTKDGHQIHPQVESPHQESLISHSHY